MAAALLGMDGFRQWVFPSCCWVSARCQNRCRATADDEFWLNDNFFQIGRVGWAVDALEQCLGRRNAHLAQRLPHGGQRRILVRRALDVIKSNNGNILRDAEAGFAQRLDSTNRGNIVERKESREWLTESKEFLGDFMSEFG